MKKTITYYVKEITLFFVLMIVFANAISLYKSSDLNKEALSIANISLIDNSEYSLPTDKPLLVHIWATWCPTCKVEAQNIQTLSKSQNILTIAVKSGSDADIKKWMQENRYTFNVVNDHNGLLSSQFNVSVFPTTFIYDKNKNLVFSDVGYTSTWGLFLRMWWASL